MTNPYRALIQRLADELQEYINYAPTGPCDEEQELVDEARALLAQPEPQPPIAAEVGELVAEQLPSLRRRLESVVKTSRSYDGYSTMTPVELADKIIDAVLAWIPFITSSSGSNFDD